MLTTHVAYLCEDIEPDYSITSTELTTWNTWLASDCDSNLYAGMAADDIRPVCIGVNATAPDGTATAPPSTTPSQTATTTSSSVSMGPTAIGEVAGCLQYYTVQSGDTCANIETIYSISFVQLYQWNPSRTSFSHPFFSRSLHLVAKTKTHSRLQLRKPLARLRLLCQWARLLHRYHLRRQPTSTNTIQHCVQLRRVLHSRERREAVQRHVCGAVSVEPGDWG